MRLALKRTIGRLLRRGVASGARKVVLIYHSVGESPWAVSRGDFVAQMRWLSQVAKVTSLGQLVDGKLDDPLQVAITFDDGYACLRDVVLPILSELGAAATVFLNTGCVGAGKARTPSDVSLGHYSEEFFLSSDDAEALVHQGWCLGSHGVRHIDLTRVEDETARVELTSSKDAVERISRFPCTLFAYTWGRYTPRLQRLVAEAGYHFAFSGRHGPLRSDMDALAIPRINIQREYSISDFQAVTCGDWDYLGALQRLKGL